LLQLLAAAVRSTVPQITAGSPPIRRGPPTFRGVNVISKWLLDATVPVPVTAGCMGPLRALIPAAVI